MICWLLLSAAAPAAPASPADLKDLPALHAEAAHLGKPSWRPMLEYLAQLHVRATHPPAEPFAYPWEELGPGYGYGPAFGHWDVVQEMLDELPTAPRHVRDELLNDLHLQLPDGFLPGSVYMPGSPSAPGAVASSKTHAVFDRGDHGHPPVWVFAADRYLNQTHDEALRRECLERATRQIAWFEAHRAAPDGGFFYNDIVIHKWESGVDDGVRFDNPTRGPKPCVDATSHVYALYHFAETWARELHEPAAAARWAAKAKSLRAFVQRDLWDPTTGFFYDRWAILDPKLRTEAFEGIWPLVVGAATPAQANAVIDRWILNPQRFNTPHPIATVGREDPHFSFRMWRGPVWNSMTYWAASACMQYHRPDAAHHLVEAALDDTAAQFQRTGTIWEYYHPLGGHPEDLTRKPYTQRNFPWRDYLGHNPLFAMARLWEATSPSPVH